MKYSYCVQCVDKTSGKVGCFAFSEDNRFVAISPVFGDLVAFYEWLNTSEFKAQSYDETGKYSPFGLVKKIDNK